MEREVIVCTGELQCTDFVWLRRVTRLAGGPGGSQLTLTAVAHRNSRHFWDPHVACSAQLRVAAKKHLLA